MESGNSNKEIISKPGNEFIDRIQRHLNELCLLRERLQSNLFISYDFENRLLILYSDIQSYISDSDKKIIIKHINELKRTPFDFEYKKKWGGSYEIIYKSGNMLLYLKKWDLMDKIESLIRDCVRENGFDVQEKTITKRPY